MTDVAFTNTAILETASSVTTWGYAGEAITRGQWVYFDKTTSRYRVADCIDSNRYAAVAVALNDAGAGQWFKLQTAGDLGCDGLTPGTSYVLSRGGKICPVADYLAHMDYLVEVGAADSATNLKLPTPGPLVSAYRASNLLGLWLLHDDAGSAVALDSSGNARHGTASAVTFGATGIGDGFTAVSLNGLAGYLGVYSAGLSGAFNGALGTLMIWAKVSGAGVWADNALRYLVRLAADANNWVRIYKNTDNKIYWEYRAGGTADAMSKTVAETGWMCLGFTWNKAGDTAQAFYSGVPEGAALGTLGIWSGALASTLCTLGARNTTSGLEIWDGSLAYAAVWDAVLTDAEMLSLATA